MSVVFNFVNFFSVLFYKVFISRKWFENYFQKKKYFIRIDVFSTDVLPAVPLVVKNPYLNTWMTSRELNDAWPTFWTGAVKGMTGIVRVNGQSYEFMGTPNQDPIGTKLRAKQIGLKVTPTQSIFTFTAGPIELTVNFFTPIDPTDLKRLSLPASYIAMNVRSLDNTSHKIQLYFDITGEWTSGDSKQVVEWDFNTISENIVNFDLRLKNPKVLQEIAGNFVFLLIEIESKIE